MAPPDCTVMLPDTPDDPAAALDTTTAPLDDPELPPLVRDIAPPLALPPKPPDTDILPPVPSDPAPLARVTLPPAPADADVVPAVMDNAPPVPVSPDPTVKLIEPPAPPTQQHHQHQHDD